MHSKFSVLLSKIVNNALIPGTILIGFGGLSLCLARWTDFKKELPHETSLINLHKQISKISLLRIPSQVRCLIWDRLCKKDTLNLRLVCSDLNHDVSYMIGLSGVIDIDKESFDFFRTITLKHCEIKNLEGTIGVDFFFDPGQLESLKLREDVFLSVSSFYNLLSPLIRLKVLKIIMKRSPIDGNADRCYCSALLDCLKSLPHLRQLDCKKMLTVTNDHWDYEVKNNNFDRNLLYGAPRKMTCIKVEFPDVRKCLLDKWQRILELQNQLQTLECNLGNLNWTFYRTTIQKNSSTLKVIKLHNIISWNETRNSHISFEWSIFSDCNKLQSLELAKARFGRFASHEEPYLIPSHNFSAFPMKSITQFFVRGIRLDREAIEIIYQYLPQMESGGLSMIGIEGIAVAAELAWTFQQQRQAEGIHSIAQYLPSIDSIEILFQVVLFLATFAFTIIARNSEATTD